MNLNFLYKVAMSFTLSVSLLLGASVFGLLNASAQAAPKSQKAIVVVSFGTTFAEARKLNIEGVENRIAQAFPEYDVYRAFTSKIVMKRLAENSNIHVNDLETVLNNLKKDGYKEVIVQTTHLTPGEEYDKKVVATVEKFNGSFETLSIGRPVLFFHGENGKPNDFAIAVNALKKQLPALQLQGKTVVFMGHGSPHQHNPAYQALQDQFDAAGLHVIVGVVEETDHPNLQDVEKLLKEKNIKKITLMPLMLVAGDHANNDMAGDEKDSWKNTFLADGYQVDTYIHGLGENTGIQDIYVQHVRDAINGLK